MNKLLLLASTFTFAAATFPAGSQSLPPAQECPPTTATGTTGTAVGPASNPGVSAQRTVPGNPPPVGQDNAAAPAVQQDGKSVMAQTDCPSVPNKVDRLKP